MKQSPECVHVRDRLDGYLDRELSSDANSEIASHLDQCPDCGEELSARRTLRSRLRTAVAGQPLPPGLETRVSAMLRGPRTERRWTLLVAAAAAMIAIAFGLSQNARRTSAEQYLQSLQGRFSAVIRVAMNDHIHCAVYRAYPKVPPSRERMANDMGPQFKDLIPVVREHVPARFRLEQAHRCTVGGRQYVHMIFRDRLDLVSVIATLRRPGESLSELPAAPRAAQIRTASVDSYRIAAFESGTFLTYIVSDMPTPENLAMATALIGPVTSFLSALAPRAAL
jgi:anti-sigma factor (TIGR02949 family)